MLITENITMRGSEFIHTYSDQKKMIRKVGTEEYYEEAYDVLVFEYEETDIDIVVIEQTNI